MSSSLLQIAASGTRAARAALDVTAQNIANASTEGYVRRSLNQTELTSHGSLTRIHDMSLFGVRITDITRHADSYRQSEMRRTGSDAARADAQIHGLIQIQDAVEHAGVYGAINQFEAAINQLAAAPTDNSLRANVLEHARTLAQNLNTASGSLDAAGKQIRFEASDGVNQINTLAGQLAQINQHIAMDIDLQGDQTSLLDQRDNILQKLSKFGDITTTLAANKTVSVQMGGASGPSLVSGNSASPLAIATAADGTISFTLGGSPLALGGGSLAGKAQALTTLASANISLDTLTASLITAANTVQTGGVALNGSAGQPLFSGTTAATIALALTSGAQLATAPSGAGAGSRDSANLTALQNALANADAAGQTNQLIFSLSSSVAANRTTADALHTIANSALVSLEAQTGVNLDVEATNLLKYQQAFQASGKVMQVASTLFDTILNLR